jgi:hypothetical protein
MIDEILVLDLGEELKFPGDLATLLMPSTPPGIYQLECLLQSNSSSHGYMHVKIDGNVISYLLNPEALATSYTISSVDGHCLEFLIIRGIWNIACFTLITHVLF